MRYFYFLALFILMGCSNEKSVILPEINNATITEILDVSPAYIFYDEAQPDSTLFNRKNLIITTNWLVNVDKRLTLKQVIPHIQFLQNKKRNAEMHKNKDAKNYFTCNDISINNLGFLEFTETNFYNKNSFKETENLCFITFESLKNVISFTTLDFKFEFSEEGFDAALEVVYKEYDRSTVKIVLAFNNAMSFQDYITIKSELKSYKNIISNDELFFNE